MLCPPSSFFGILSELFLSRHDFETANPSNGPGEEEYSHNMTPRDLVIKDAFLVFRALCKLTMKPLSNERLVNPKSNKFTT